MKYVSTSISVICLILLQSFTFSQNVAGTFLCNMNGKEVLLKDAKAQYRTITGGFRQLSLSNDKFEAFVFINPVVGRIELKETDNRHAYVRYVDPGTDKIYKPAGGYVDIQSLDLEKGVVSGVFEMVLVNRENGEKKNGEKKITVKNGKFQNVPISEIKPY
jgi:hypothetical protein